MHHKDDPGTRKTAQNVALIDRARRGDHQAFATLYSRYRPEVHRYLLSRTPDRHLAEDLTSETFLHALRGIDTFRWKGRDFGAWLVTIARNLLSDHYKCARHHREVLVMDISVHDAPLPSAEEKVMDVMETRLNNRLALNAVAALPPNWQKVIILRYWEGWRDQLIAQHLDLPTTGAVRVMRYRAMRDLRKALAPERTAKRRTTAAGCGARPVGGPLNQAASRQMQETTAI